MRRNRYALGACLSGRAGRPSSRAGMTLLEVLAGLAIFMVGSVSIVGLFVTASVLHAEASHRRTTSFIMESLLAQVRAMPMREVYARTTVTADPGTGGGGNIDVSAVTPDLSRQAATFDFYPVHPLFDVRSDPTGALAERTQGPVLIEGESGGTGTEWAWYSDPDINPDPLFDTLVFATGPPPDRWLWSSVGVVVGIHSAAVRVLGPRTWHYVVEAPGLAAGALAVIVAGEPDTQPAGGAPTAGYIVIDEEWMAYDGPTLNSFTNLDRGWGGTEDVDHQAGTPVTVAREHPYYPGFYYTVQFYPVNATGAESHVVISVGYGNPAAFRVHTVRSIYSPATF